MVYALEHLALKDCKVFSIRPAGNEVVEVANIC